MNKKFITLLSFCLFCVICLVSCERYPVRALLGIPDRFDSWPNPWYIYDDEINTKGSLEPFKWESYTGCADWDKVKLDFACRTNPKNGRKCMQLYWEGNSQDLSSTYFGFGLRATEYPKGVINLSTSGYTTLKFWIRGKLEANCSFTISIPKNEEQSWVFRTLSNAEITSNWTEYTIQLPYIEDMTAIEYDIAISLIADGVTNGGEVYLDDIRLCKD